MAKNEEAAVQDDTMELEFPSFGVNLALPTAQDRPEYTPVANNVRFFDPITHRGRGGSRPGIDPFADDQVSGDNPIQHLTSVVAIDGEYIDWSFDGPEQRFPGLHFGIIPLDFDPFLFGPVSFPVIFDDGNPFSETFDTNATSGYRPKGPKNEKIVTTIVPDAYSESVGAPVQLTIHLRNKDGGFLSAATLTDKNIVLYTDPADAPGNGDFGSAGGSEMLPIVTSLTRRIVTYRAVVMKTNGVIVSRSNTTHISWLGVTPQITWANPAAITEGTPLGTTQLNATAGYPNVGAIAGVFVYTPPSGTILSVGTHTLHVDFEPEDHYTFTSASKDVSITVNSSGEPDVPPEDVTDAFIAAIIGSGPTAQVTTTSFLVSGSPHGPVTALPDPDGTEVPSDPADIGLPLFSLRRFGGVWYYVVVHF